MSLEPRIAPLGCKAVNGNHLASGVGHSALCGVFNQSKAVTMKSDYSIMVFTEDEAANAATLQNRDYHTLCVIQDATGYTPSGKTMAMWVKGGQSFPIDPAWPCCRSRAEYAAHGAKLASVKGGAQ